MSAEPLGGRFRRDGTPVDESKTLSGRTQDSDQPRVSIHRPREKLEDERGTFNRRCSRGRAILVCGTIVIAIRFHNRCRFAKNIRGDEVTTGCRSTDNPIAPKGSFIECEFTTLAPRAFSK